MPFSLVGRDAGCGEPDLFFVGYALCTVNIELNANMEFACPPSILPHGAQRFSRVGRRVFGAKSSAAI